MTLRVIIAVLCASFTIDATLDVREKCIEKGFFK